MSIEERLAKLEASNRLLEKKLHGYKIGALIFAVCISLFLYVKWIEIPEKVDAALKVKITEETSAIIDEALIKAEKLSSLDSYLKIGDKVSFKPITHLDNFVRHKSGKVRIDKIYTPQEHKDSTFILSKPNK